jgi:hypothetical protein
LTFEGPLLDESGRDSGAVLKVSYIHRWGHVKIRQELQLPPDGIEVKALLMHQWTVRPELSWFGVRPGAAAEPSNWLWAFGTCQWGRFAPGRSFDVAYESRHVPRYVCLAEPGRRGLEWFVGSQLSQWDYQVAGGPGHGHLYITSTDDPLGMLLRVRVLDLPDGSLRVRGRHVFDSYVGIPILTGQAHRPYLNRSFQRNHWPTRDTIAAWAGGGVGTAHFHHDGDSFRDGLFWRDGTYPPFGPDDMAEYDRVIADCHDHGIRVATYFSNKQLHPSTADWKAHGTDWARLSGDRQQVLHDYWEDDEFGAEVCLRSGWLEVFKQYVDTVLSHHDLDGTYYDFNVALYCHNAAHEDLPPVSPGMGDWAHSPAGHWDIDELMDLMDWTRRRVGPDGLMIVHNTMVPMAAAENYADYVVTMEWGYSKLITDAPALGDLPLEWSFMGSRSRGIIGSGSLSSDTPERLHRQLTLRCLLTGVAPWPARDLDCEMFAPLMRHDLTGCRFEDWRNGIARLDVPGTATAVYRRADRLIVLAGELTGQGRTATCTIDLSRWGVRPGGDLVAWRDGERLAVRTDASGRAHMPVKLPPDGLSVITIASAAP